LSFDFHSWLRSPREQIEEQKLNSIIHSLIAKVLGLIFGGCVVSQHSKVLKNPVPRPAIAKSKAKPAGIEQQAVGSKKLRAINRRHTQILKSIEHSAKRIASGSLFQPFFDLQSSILDYHPSPFSPQSSFLVTD
jgi:hypothetical protein